MGGYAGKLLRVDLSARTVKDEPLPPEDVLRKYVGGLGLGAWYIWNEVPLHVKALDPENRLIFLTGPVTGTAVMSSSDWTITSIRHELDSKTIHGSHSHGYWGAFLKFNGYDGIIVQGASDTPVYLSIEDGKTEIRDATKLWGLDTHETEDAVKADLGGDPASISVAAIGPAGENLVASALVENDYLHSASKGMGAIMGAKKLKAIAVNRGPYTIKIEKPLEFLDVAKNWRDAVAPHHVLAHAVRSQSGGDPDAPYFTAGKNYGDPEWARQFRTKFVTETNTLQIDPKGCWGCSSPCAYRIKVGNGPHAGYEATLAGGWENSEGSAGMAGVDEPGTVLYLTDLIDRIGLDAGTVACSIGLAIECYEKGMLTKEKTGGLELRWGDGELTEKLWRMAAYREGEFGNVLAEGPKAVADYVGGNAHDMAVHVKGAGPNLHDWRANPSIIVAQAVCPAGPCWQSSLGVEMFPEPDIGLHQPMDRFNQEGKAGPIAKSMTRATFEDCNGVCWFAANIGARCIPGYHTWMAQTVAYATGWEDFTADTVMEVGERVLTLQRSYAMLRGMTKQDDLDIGPRFMEPHKVGLTKGLDIRPHLDTMVEEFYASLGWDQETGKPLPETLRRLDLDFLIDPLWNGSRAPDSPVSKTASRNTGRASRA